MKAKLCGARTIAILLVVALISVPLASMSAQGNATVLTVGFIGAASGRQATLDQNLYQAAVLAAEQINTSDDYGVVSDDNIRYRFDVVYYAANSAEEAEDAYRMALIDGAVAVLGLEQTRLLDAVAGDESPDLPLLVADAGDLAGEDNVFQLSASTESWIQAAADYLVEERFATQIATVAVDTESAQNGADLFAVLAGDDHLALSITHAADADDLSSEAQDIVDAKADAVFVWSLDSTGSLLLQELEALGWEGPVVYVGLDQTVIDAVGSPMAANLIGLNPWSTAAYDAYSERFVSDYESRWGQTPEEHAAAYYDAVNLLAAAVQSAGDSPTLISSALVDSDAIEGVQGTYVGTGTDALHLIQPNGDGVSTDLAFYEGGICLSCADLILPELDSEDSADAEPYHIALITTLTGINADAGDAAQMGAELAIREIERQGGVLGADDTVYDLRLGTYNATTATGAATAFSDALADDAQIILGPEANAQVNDNTSLAGDAGVVQLVTATGLEDPAGADLSLFQLRASDADQAQAAVNYLVDERGFTQVAAITVRANYGNAAERAIWDAFDELDDARLVLDYQHNASETDYAGMAARVIDSGAEAVLVWSPQPVVSGLLAELGAAGWGGTVVYGYLTPDFVESLSVPAGIDLVGPVSWWPVAGDGTSAGFVARYEARYGELPSSQSAAYYDAVYLIARAIQEVGPDPADILAWLDEDTDFIGVQGVYAPASESNGVLNRSVLMVNLTDGTDGLGSSEAARYVAGVCASQCAVDSVVWRFSGTPSSSSSSSGSSWLTEAIRERFTIVEMGYNVNLRTLPDLDDDVSTVMDVIPYETEVPAFALSEDGEWAVVFYNGRFGWIMLDYVSVTSGNLSTLEVSARDFS